MDIKNLRIDRIIIHQIFKRNDKSEIVPPFISQRLAELDREGSEQFSARVVEALGDDSHSAEMNIEKVDEGSAFQHGVDLIFRKKPEFIKGTAFFANKLAEAQTTRRYPGGILVVFSGRVGRSDTRFFGLLKAESQGGFTKKVDGNALELEYFKDLVLTPANKFYKIGVFIEKSRSDKKAPYKPEDFHSLVYDYKLTATETRLGAIYFSEVFLGCKFALSDKKQTQDFYEYTKAYINDNIENQEDRLDLHNSLYSYLKVDQSPVISANEFAKRFFPLGQRDDYQKSLKDSGVGTRNINKDLSYIKSKLRRRSMRFNTKVAITAPADQFDKLVKIVRTKANSTTIEIKGEIEAVK